jgi:hypothetical protein
MIRDADRCKITRVVCLGEKASLVVKPAAADQ